MSAEISWLERFEPVGINCEIGFVLDRLGSKRPSLFRWNDIAPKNLCRLLDASFAEAFSFENLKPISESILLDTMYDWAFHSALQSGADKKFLLEDREIRRLHRIEKVKIEADERTFSERLTSGRLICTLAAPRLQYNELDDVLAAIDRFSNNNTNQLLAVTEPIQNASDAGNTYRYSARIMRGFVSRIAPFDHADDADYLNWEKILRACAGETG